MPKSQGEFSGPYWNERRGHKCDKETDGSPQQTRAEAYQSGKRMMLMKCGGRRD